jgi:hypothetical protein
MILKGPRGVPRRAPAILTKCILWEQLKPKSFTARACGILWVVGNGSEGWGMFLLSHEQPQPTSTQNVMRKHKAEQEMMNESAE